MKEAIINVTLISVGININTIWTIFHCFGKQPILIIALNNVEINFMCFFVISCNVYKKSIKVKVMNKLKETNKTSVNSLYNNYLRKICVNKL